MPGSAGLPAGRGQGWVGKQRSGIQRLPPAPLPPPCTLLRISSVSDCSSALSCMRDR